jgi:hypothetical protein
MASEVKADKLSPSSGTTLTLGDASDTVTLPTGVTFNLVDGLGVAAGGTGLASFTAGDILYATGSTTLAKLGKGTGLQGLQTNSGATAPEWAASPQSVLTAAGDVMYASSANTLARLAKGAATEVLAMNSGATAPEWVTAGAGTTIKRYYYEYSTRTAGAGAGVVFNFTTGFIPTDPVNNDIDVRMVVPVKGTSSDWTYFGVRFSKSGGSDYDYLAIGEVWCDPNTYQSMNNSFFNISAGDLPAGTYTVGILAGNANAAPATQYFCLNTTDNTNVGAQTVATLMLTEWKN